MMFKCALLHMILTCCAQHRQVHKEALTQGGAVWDTATWQQRYEIMLRYQRGILERDIHGVPLHEGMEEEAEDLEEDEEVEIYKYGYLEKMGQVNTKWQKRFFELKDGLLAYWFVCALPPVSTLSHPPLRF